LGGYTVLSDEPTLVTGVLPGPESADDKFNDETREKKPRGRAAAKAKAEALEEELSARIREYIAIPLGMVSPLGMAVLDQRADRTSYALCRVAATSPAMRRALERFVQGSALADVTGTAVAVAIAVGVDLHRIEPNSLPARFAGVPKAWRLVYPDEQMWVHEPNGNGNTGADFRGSFGLDNDEPFTGN